MLCGSAWRLLRLRRERREVRRRRQNVVERLPFCDASLRHVRDEARMREILHHSPPDTARAGRITSTRPCDMPDSERLFQNVTRNPSCSVRGANERFVLGCGWPYCGLVTRVSYAPQFARLKTLNTST